MPSFSPISRATIVAKWSWRRRHQRPARFGHSPNNPHTTPPTLLFLLTLSALIMAAHLGGVETSTTNQLSTSNDNLAITGRSHLPAASISMNWHEPRIELRYNSKSRLVSLDEKAPNRSVVAIVIVSDEDVGPSGETDLSIVSGNELGHFRLVSTSMTNTIQVCGAPLSRQSMPEYNLTLVARDHGQPARMSAVNLLIRLTSLPPVQAPLEPTSWAFKPPPVGELLYVGALLVILFSASIFFIIIGCALVQKPRGKKPMPLAGGGCASSGQTTSTATSWNTNSAIYSL